MTNPKADPKTTLYFGGREYLVRETSIVTPRSFGHGDYPPGTTVKLTRVTHEGVIYTERFRIEKELGR